MTRKIAVLLLSLAAPLALAGCVSPEELRAQDEAACSGYGFQFGTPAFATCLQNESLSRQAYWAAMDSYDLYGPFGPYGVGYYPGPFLFGGYGGYRGGWAGGWHGGAGGWRGGAGGWHGGHFAGAAHGGHGGGGGGHR